MKQSKQIAWDLARIMSQEELADKEGVSEEVYIRAGVSEDFQDKLIEVGIKEVAKQCKRLAKGFEECSAISAEEETEGRTWTLQEVQSIVDLVRAGKPVQIAYYAPEEDDDPYVHKACW